MALARHSFVVQDDHGNVVTDAQVEVRREIPGQPLASIYSDRDGSMTLGNPFPATDGNAAFHAAGGAYRVRAFKTGFESIQRYVGIGLGSESDLQIIRIKGAWDNDVTYSIGDLVFHEIALFISLQDGNLNNEPDAGSPVGDTEFWMVAGETAQGPPGAAATIAVGTVDTIEPGEPATVTNVGTSSAAVFNFEIPAGEQGEPGEDGTITNVKNSIEVDSGDVQLVGDEASPGNNKVYGTDGSGARGWKDDPAGGGRELLTANRTYYVRTDGSDSNDGLTNSSGGAFLTIQKAIDVACALDLSVYAVTIQVGDGTYTGTIRMKNYVGAGPITILGNSTTPANVVLDISNALCIANDFTGRRWNLQYCKVQSSTSGAIGLSCSGGGSILDLTGMNYGAITGSGIHLFASRGGLIQTNGSYAISGGTGWHMFIDADGVVYGGGSQTITFTGSPAFSQQTYRCTNGSVFRTGTITNSGTVTGTRYLVSTNSVIDTAGGGASYLAGNGSGSTATGGQYV